jgi:hypothetical protein
MYFYRFVAYFIAVSSAFLGLSAANAGTVVTLPMNSANSANAGTGNSNGRVFTITVGATTVKVRVTAWSTTGTTASSSVQKGSLNVYSNGLGDTSVGETTSSPHHTVDNLTKADFLIFQFDQPVELESGKFTTYNMGSTRFDGDATYAHATTTANWQTDLLPATTNYAQLAAIFGSSFTASNVASTSSQTSTTRLLNPTNSIGNVWLIGAAFSNPLENCGTTGNKECLDGFKLSQLTVKTAVPEPATWMMMLFGFGFIGFAMRRKKSARLAAA